MNLRQQLQSFYSDVHSCVKGPDHTRLAWEIVECAIESTQDDGTTFVLDKGNTTVDGPRLEVVLEKHGLHGTVEIATATGGGE
jgi:hypothetical protein